MQFGYVSGFFYSSEHDEWIMNRASIKGRIGPYSQVGYRKVLNSTITIQSVHQQDKHLFKTHLNSYPWLYWKLFCCNHSGWRKIDLIGQQAVFEIQNPRIFTIPFTFDALKHQQKVIQLESWVSKTPRNIWSFNLETLKLILFLFFLESSQFCLGDDFPCFFLVPTSRNTL